MKLRAYLALALAAVCVALFGTTTSAGAASVNGPAAYPAKVCSTLSVSTTNPNPGQKITITGTAFLPNVKVKLILQAVSSSASGFVKIAAAAPTNAKTYDLVTVTTDASGAFSINIAMPDSITNGGHYNVVATTGYDTAGSCPADPYQNLAFNAVAASSSANGGGGGSSNNGGGTAFTGLNVLLLVLVAAALIGVGVVVNRRGSARRA